MATYLKLPFNVGGLQFQAIYIGWISASAVIAFSIGNESNGSEIQGRGDTQYRSRLRRGLHHDD